MPTIFPNLDYFDINSRLLEVRKNFPNENILYKNVAIKDYTGYTRIFDIKMHYEYYK